ncbi:unnamed protein product [Paramecium sonneborni]|uniref:Uncharacterized protein n=1 Tax=Paramecium sonneborni TaxID=65129 RepID=A0A8S1KWL2_9CILI|nr:unnamed protein product [Paramecium sonneborni]
MAQCYKGFTWTICKNALKLKILSQIQQYSNNSGWNWHKSWNIPNISVKISIQEEECTY